MENKDIKITLFTDTLCEPNDISKFLEDMSNEAINNNVKLNIISSTSNLNCNCYKNHNIHILKPIFKIRIPFYNNINLIIPPVFKMNKILKDQKPDFVHISTHGLIGISAYILASMKKIPKIATYHTDFPINLYKNSRCLVIKNMIKYSMRLFYKGFTSMITRSKEFFTVISKDMKVNEDNIHLLELGTNTNNFNPSYKDNTLWKTYNLDNQRLKFLYVGELSTKKNLNKLFDIWVSFHSCSVYKNSDLIIVGSGELDSKKDELKKYNIHFLGEKTQNELSSIYATSDMFVYPSTTEILGQVILESMASSTPVLVTNKGAPKSIIENSKNEVGFILDLEKKSDWIDLLIDIEQNKIDLDILSENAYNYASKLTITNTFKSFIDIHQKNLT